MFVSMGHLIQPVLIRPLLGIGSSQISRHTLSIPTPSEISSIYVEKRQFNFFIFWTWLRFGVIVSYVHRYLQYELSAANDMQSLSHSSGPYLSCAGCLCDARHDDTCQHQFCTTSCISSLQPLQHNFSQRTAPVKYLHKLGISCKGNVLLKPR